MQSPDDQRKRGEPVMKDLKVLLVDDEEDFVQSLSERMKLRDVGSEVALDGSQALRKIEEQKPDVIVLDLKMPGMHGLEVLEKVKAAYPGIEVIILTGHGSDKDQQEADRLGAYAYLRKPVGLERLMKVVTDAYRRKIERTMAASAMAEGGDPDSALEMMEQEPPGGEDDDGGK
jgi:DNA-binding NtrC family response regulator